MTRMIACLICPQERLNRWLCHYFCPHHSCDCSVSWVESVQLKVYPGEMLGNNPPFHRENLKCVWTPQEPGSQSVRWAGKLRWNSEYIWTTSLHGDAATGSSVRFHNMFHLTVNLSASCRNMCCLRQKYIHQLWGRKRRFWIASSELWDQSLLLFNDQKNQLELFIFTAKIHLTNLDVYLFYFFTTCVIVWPLMFIAPGPI